MIKWIVLVLLLIGFAVFAWLSWHYAEAHAVAQPSVVGPPPARFPGKLEEVTIKTSDGLHLKGWFAAPAGTTRAVLLLHQYGGNRLNMLERARLFYESGYAVLLYDARAHGESEGDLITVGFHETRDLLAALELLRSRGMTDLACVGWSQGAATILMSAKQLRDVRCVVLESAFDTFARSIDRGFRKHIGLPAGLVDWLYTRDTEKRLGFKVEAFRPIDHAADLPCPVYILSGTRDCSTWASDTKEIFDACPEPKTLWMVEGADHQDLYPFAPEEYRQRILPFLAESLVR